jgi:hypothetical protein
MSSLSDFDALRTALNAPPTASKKDADYEITNSIGHAFVARSRSGFPTLLIPLEHGSNGLSRSGGGFSLIPAERVAYEFSARKWEQASAALECTERALLDTFVVLCVDLIARLTLVEGKTTWSSVTKWVDEWQALLGKKPRLSPEQELGLWGELWLLSQSNDTNRLIAAWRGPEREHVDFFLDGIGIEVKTSRREHLHFVSQKQIERPVGAFDAYLLSIWVAPEPSRGSSLTQLIDSILARAADGPAFLRHLGRLGYSAYDHGQYQTRFALLDIPRWFPAANVPRVRAADDGISNLRYQLSLDVENAAGDEAEGELWRRVVGRVPTLASIEENVP